MIPMAKDFYEVLDIPRDSSPQQIRRAYKTLVKKWHPDKHPVSSKPEAEARFKAITQAYEALHDQEHRSMFGVYNEGAGKVGGGGSRDAASARGGSTPPPPPPLQRNANTAAKNFKDVYYSQSAFTYSGSQRRKPPPIERKLELTLEELCLGCKKDITFTRDIVKEGMIVQKQETQTIKVKPGWKKGTKITFEGMGDERPGCLPADVVYLIAEKEHPIFKRVGNDLVLKVEIPLVNALTGWSFAFRVLTGEKTKCKLEDEEVVYPGYEKVLKGQGMPVANDKGERGDLKIKFQISFPKQLSAEQRSAIREALEDTN